MVRAPYFDKDGVKKGAWSAQEDDKLRFYIQKYGLWNWRELPKLAGLQRCGKSCRLRWMNYLRPDVKLGSYTKEEDDLIIQLHEKFGSKWSRIAARLPGRTDNEIKNHWHTHLKKRTKDLQAGVRSSSEGDSHDDVTQNSSSSNKSEAQSRTTVCDVPFHPILESSPFSPKDASAGIQSSGGDSHGDANQNSSSESEAQSSPSVCDVPFLPILESSPLSPKEASPTDFSVIGTNDGLAGDSLGSVLEMCQELISIGDFWTEPFVADNYMDNQSYQFSSFEGGILPSYAPYSDDDLDLLCQVMNKLPHH